MDNGWIHFGVSSEIIAAVSERLSTSMEKNPIRIGIEDVPIPSTRALAKYVYPTPLKIAQEIIKILELDLVLEEYAEDHIYDQPDSSFTGPF